MKKNYEYKVDFEESLDIHFMDQEFKEKISKINEMLSDLDRVLAEKNKSDSHTTDE